MVAVLVTLAGTATLPSDAAAYQWSALASEFCGVCTTPAGEQLAGQLAETLNPVGSQAGRFGSTAAAITDAGSGAAGTAAAAGAESAAASLGGLSVSSALAASPLATGGLAIGALVTGYAIGTQLRSIAIKIGGGEAGSGVNTTRFTQYAPVSWRMCTTVGGCDFNYGGDTATTIHIDRFDSALYWSYPGTSANPMTRAPRDYTYQNQPDVVQGFGPWEDRPTPSIGHRVTRTAGSYTYGVWVAAPSELIKSTKVVTTPTAPSPAWQTLPSPSPLTQDQKLAGMDAAIAANPAFGAWVNTQVAGALAEDGDADGDGQPDPVPTPTPSPTPTSTATTQPDPSPTATSSPGSGTGTGTDTDTDPGEGHGGFPSINVPAINLTPLKRTTPCTTFPFGVPCYVVGVVGGFGGGGQCPKWEMDLPAKLRRGDLHARVDMCDAQPVVDIVRPVLFIAALLGFLWIFAAFAFGKGGD